MGFVCAINSTRFSKHLYYPVSKSAQDVHSWQSALLLLRGLNSIARPSKRVLLDIQKVRVRAAGSIRRAWMNIMYLGMLTVTADSGIP